MTRTPPMEPLLRIPSKENFLTDTLKKRCSGKLESWDSNKHLQVLRSIVSATLCLILTMFSRHRIPAAVYPTWFTFGGNDD